MRESNGELRISSDTRVFMVGSPRAQLRKLAKKLQCEILQFTADKDPIEADLLDLLLKNDLLIPADTVIVENGSPLDLYLTHIGCNPTGLASLQNKRVAILGLGGTGTGVLQHLVGAGIQHFLFLDFDVVTQHNLELQFIYRGDDIGRLKIYAAMDYVRQRCATAQIVTVEGRISSENDLETVIHYKPDIVFVCIDDPPEESFAISACMMWKNRVPVIHGGVMIRSGFFGPLFAPHFSPLPPASFPLRLSSSPGAIDRFRIAFSPVNSIISAFLAGEAAHFLSGATHVVDFAHRTFVDLDRGTITKVSGLGN